MRGSPRRERTSNVSAADQIATSAGGATLKGADLENRVRDVGLRLNVQNLANQIRQKLADEPANLRDLRRFARDGDFRLRRGHRHGTLKDVKDRALYFKNDQRPLVHGEPQGRSAGAPKE